MIVVKTKVCLRIKENGKKKVLPSGAVFRGRTIEDLPGWLQDHVEYNRNTPCCDTLLIKETFEVDSSTLVKTEPALKVQGTLIVDAVKDKTDVKDIKEDEKPLPEVELDPKIQPKETVDLKVEPTVLPKDVVDPKIDPKPKKVPRPRKRTSKKSTEKKGTLKLKKRTPK